MIPAEQLQTLKPLPDMLNRARMVKRKAGRNPPKKTKLTRRARQYASAISSIQNPKLPSGWKWKGAPKMKDRVKKN